MAQQDLNGAQIRARFEQMRGETVAQRVWIDNFMESGPPGSFFAGMVDRLGRDGPITGLTTLARK